MIEPRGWNTWDVRHLNAVVHLPSMVRVRFVLYNPQTGEIKDEFGWRSGLSDLGPHAADGSYCSITLRWNDAHIGLEYAAQNNLFICRVTPGDNAQNLVLGVETSGAWNTTVAHITTLIQASQPALDDKPAPFTSKSINVFNLHQPFTVQVSLTSAPHEADNMLQNQYNAYVQSRLISQGWLNEAADALTGSIHWNTIWEPIKGRICTPVSRDWCKSGNFGSYVLFDWDTFFCAVMAALEDPNLAAANIRAIVREITPRGFVPNFGSEYGGSDDRSQPPVGAYCVLKLYHMSSLYTENRNRALLEETYPLLLRWHEWWFTARDGNGDGLLEWGSDPLTEGAHKWEDNNAKAAMYESGLDNSPMWDDVPFNTETHTMELAAVDLNALYAMDAWALSQIAGIIGHHSDAERLEAEWREMGERINRELWNEEAGIYQNKHWDGRLSTHISPTCFYPMIAGIATPERAERMIHEHLLNPEEFWGEYVIPSIARSDTAYPDQEYWRGRVWAPMNFLVAEGLRRYRFDVEAHQFARKGLNLLMGEWHAESHVHENYNCDTGDGDDVRSSDPMYTWGALLGYIALQEMADGEAWGGWRFGNLSSDSASLINTRVHEGVLKVKTDASGLQVDVNDTVLLESDYPVIVTRFIREAQQLAFHVITGEDGQLVNLTLGHLPASAGLEVTINNAVQTMNTDQNGHMTIELKTTTDILIRWESSV